MATQLRNEALLGYDASNLVCPYLATSCSADAWQIGKWLLHTGRTAPRDVRKSRGDTYHVNGMKVQIHYQGGIITKIDRIA